MAAKQAKQAAAVETARFEYFGTAGRKLTARASARRINAPFCESKMGHRALRPPPSSPPPAMEKTNPKPEASDLRGGAR